MIDLSFSTCFSLGRGKKAIAGLYTFPESLEPYVVLLNKNSGEIPLKVNDWHNFVANSEIISSFLTVSNNKETIRLDFEMLTVFLEKTVRGKAVSFYYKGLNFPDSLPRPKSESVSLVKSEYSKLIIFHNRINECLTYLKILSTLIINQKNASILFLDTNRLVPDQLGGAREEEGGVDTLYINDSAISPPSLSN